MLESSSTEIMPFAARIVQSSDDFFFRVVEKGRLQQREIRDSSSLKAQFSFSCPLHFLLREQVSLAEQTINGPLFCLLLSGFTTASPQL